MQDLQAPPGTPKPQTMAMTPYSGEFSTSGPVSIAMLATAIKSIVERFWMIDVAKTAGPDQKLMISDLDIELTFLLFWAHNVGLATPDFDHRLGNDADQNTIIRIFGDLNMLLSDHSELRWNHGLEEASRLRPTDADGNFTTSDESSQWLRTPCIGMASWASYIHDYTTTYPYEAHTKGAMTLTPDDVHWIITEASAFKGLLAETRACIRRLYAAIPLSFHRDSSRPMIKHELSGVQDVNVIKFMVQISLDLPFFHILDSVAADRIVEMHWNHALQRIYFPNMYTKYYATPAPAGDSFDWVLDLDKTTCGGEGTNLSDWLKASKGLYWISGASGCGKSVLMKYLASSKVTLESLKPWAQGANVQVCSAFPHGRGSSHQLSFSGTIRTLLHQVLCSHPKAPLAAIIPKTYDQINQQLGHPDHDFGFPTTIPDDLQRALESAMNICHANHGTKFLVLIDGLDEVNEDHKALFPFIGKISQRKDTRIIVSTRDLLRWDRAFSVNGRLLLDTAEQQWERLKGLGRPLPRLRK
ncbi:Prion-inhibition and propagation [Microdochium nivale]|nr:Prion-inhibition and propagation [Microdochium nivale]